MSAENSQSTSLKQKAAHETKEIVIVFLYLAFLFCVLATYSMLLLEKFHISYFTYGAALLNAFVITKTILIGEAAHLGKRHEAKPLLYSAVYKAFKDQGRAVQDRHGNAHALPLAQTQLRRPPLQELLIGRQADILQSKFNCGSRLRLSLAHVGFPGFVKLHADRKGRIKRGQRTLQHDAHIFAANRPQFPLRCLQNILPTKPHFAGNAPAFQREQSHQRKRKSALARTALSHESQDFSALHAQGNVLEDTAFVAVVHREIRGEQRFLQCHLFAPIAPEGFSRIISMFQNACGFSATGAAPTRSGEMAESAFLFTR